MHIMNVFTLDNILFNIATNLASAQNYIYICRRDSQNMISQFS